ncbi:hypothetical protein [Gimesia panareensis]|nr:hypothetical protein [Gimesia panareensis]
MNGPVSTFDDHSRPSFRQKAGAAVMCLMSLLLLYFLMAGPLVWLEGKMKFRPFSQTVKTVYAPLAQVVKSDWEPASTVVKAYVGLFKK